MTNRVQWTLAQPPPREDRAGREPRGRELEIGQAYSLHPDPARPRSRRNRPARPASYGEPESPSVAPGAPDPDRDPRRPRRFRRRDAQACRAPRFPAATASASEASTSPGTRATIRRPVDVTSSQTRLFFGLAPGKAPWRLESQIAYDIHQHEASRAALHLPLARKLLERATSSSATTGSRRTRPATTASRSTSPASAPSSTSTAHSTRSPVEPAGRLAGALAVV